MHRDDYAHTIGEISNAVGITRSGVKKLISTGSDHFVRRLFIYNSMLMLESAGLDRDKIDEMISDMLVDLILKNDLRYTLEQIMCYGMAAWEIRYQNL